MSRLRPVHIAVLVLVIAYCGTIGSAALFPFAFGREQLAAYFYPQPVPLQWMTTLGSPLYWVLLLLIIVLAPASALASERITTRLIVPARLPDIPIWAPLSLAAALAAFCVYKLAVAGGLSASEVWDRSICNDVRIIRRVELINLLGTRFYCFAYSSLPMIGCYLLAQGILRKDRLALISCAIVSVLIIWFDIAIMMRAPAVIYIGTLGLTLAICGFGLLRSIGSTGPAAIALYVFLTAPQSCTNALGVTTTARQTNPIIFAQTNPVIEKAAYILRGAMFRMAVGFPYYVQTFSEPDERCGIVLPPLRWVPKQTCFGPVKIFNKIYPHMTYATGFQPAPISISAYGEAGPWYALAATIACGLIIGGLSGFAGTASPLSIMITVTCCIYAYYVSQTSLTGSLIDSYGLIWLLFPFAVMMIVGLIRSSRICADNQ